MDPEPLPPRPPPLDHPQLPPHLPHRRRPTRRTTPPRPTLPTQPPCLHHRPAAEGSHHLTSRFPLGRAAAKSCGLGRDNPFHNRGKCSNGNTEVVDWHGGGDSGLGSRYGQECLPHRDLQSVRFGGHTRVAAPFFAPFFAVLPDGFFRVSIVRRVSSN
jgi:hypothetical protein